MSLVDIVYFGSFIVIAIAMIWYGWQSSKGGK